MQVSKKGERKWTNIQNTAKTKEYSKTHQDTWILLLVKRSLGSYFLNPFMSTQVTPGFRTALVTQLSLLKHSFEKASVLSVLGQLNACVELKGAFIPVSPEPCIATVEALDK